MTHRRTSPASRNGAREGERRVRASLFLPGLSVADGEWLGQVLPDLLRHARPEPQAVCVEDVALRYRSGRLGVADALDATALLLAPLSAAGAAVERRGEWYIVDEDEDDEEDLFDTDRPVPLVKAPDQDLLVSVRVNIDAVASDAGAAALYWAVLALLSA